MPDASEAAGSTLPAGGPRDEPSYELIELFFFAYRDFVGAPDRILAEYGFGRAHHRVLHFVARNPDLTITDLLDILKITKQSLNRVLKELVDKGFVAQRTGRADRRQRLLSPTAEGRDLAARLARLQGRRIANALGTSDAGACRETVARFLFGMVDAPERETVRKRLAGAMMGG